MKKLIFLFLIFSAPIFSWAQTRNPNGSPGKDYWQNFSKYSIDAEFDPKLNVIKGKETVVYENNSPDFLDKIIFNVYQDLYRKDYEYRKIKVDKRELDLGVKITVKENPNIESIERNGTKLIVNLKENLSPKNSISIDLEWSDTLAPYSNNRYGKSGNSWMVGYWYPQIAVYDDIMGWDTIQHTGNEEFYFEYANYDVRLKLTGNYWALGSGVLQNRDEIFKPEISERFVKASKSEKPIVIIKPREKAVKKSENIFHFKADSISDFAFCCSKQFSLNGANYDGINIFTAYPKNSGLDSCTYNSLKYFSEVFPKVKYPYPQITIFEDKKLDGGMEFPMMVNIQNYKNKVWKDGKHCTAHEIAHTYFPFMTGVNQAAEGWLDEQMASWMPYYFMNYSDSIENQIPSKHKFTTDESIDMLWKWYTTDFAVTEPTYNLPEDCIYDLCYGKPELALYYLHKLLGAEKMNEFIHDFILNWRNKHASGKDFFNALSAAYGENLDWFINPWYNSTKSADLRIAKICKDDKGYFARVENLGGVPVPVVLYANNSQNLKIYYHNCDVWKNGDKFFDVYLDDFELAYPTKFLVGNYFIWDDNWLDNTFYLNESEEINY